ncbi:MAG TPA: hypothetical protein VEC99_00420 [Clostridia bacterium]|nr:hypothetical protein [Clostridia bacterium]
MKRTLIVAKGGRLLVLAGLSLACSAQANLVLNGGFENGLSSWNVVGDPGVYVADALTGEVNSFDGANVTEGTHAIDLGVRGYANGNSISQILNTQPGKQYLLTFDWGSEYAWGTTANVAVGDLNTTITDPERYPRGSGTSRTPWIIHTSNFTFLASGNDTLSFSQPLNPSEWGGLALDNVRVELIPTSVPVPEPGTMIAGALMAIPLGISALRGLRNRRRLS